MAKKISAKSRKWENMKRRGCECAKCGYIFSFEDMTKAHYHHKTSVNKAFNLSDGFAKYSNDKVNKELKKTILLCDKCHTKLHKTLGKAVTTKQTMEYIKGVEA